MAKYQITYKQYLQFCKKNKVLVPTWLNETVFNEALEIMETQGKLHICKYLTTKSTENNTRDRFDLKWSKMCVADVLDLYLVAPVTSNENGEVISLNIEEILRVLEPFRQMAQECLYNSNLHRDQVVYAYNKAQITMANLRDVELLVYGLKKIK